MGSPALGSTACSYCRRFPDSQRYDRTVARRYSKFRYAATRRGHALGLSVHDLELLTSGVCHYCSQSLTLCGSNLDRVNNSLGYSLANVVPCCRECNQAKGSYWTYQEFLQIGRLLGDLKLARKTA